MFRLSRFGIALCMLAGCDSSGPSAPGADLAITTGTDGGSDGAMPTPDMAKGTDGPLGDMAVAMTTVNAVLSGGQETPPVDTMAHGTATFAVDANKTMITVTLNVSALNNITAAHIHFGKPGIAGPVIFPLASGTFQSPLTKTLTAADFNAGGGLATFADAATAVLAGQTYVNVHTMANPGGEIRGHIGPLTFKGVLSGGQETPPNTSTAAGTISIALSATHDQLDVTLDAGTLANITAAHFHAGPSASPGR